GGTSQQTVIDWEETSSNGGPFICGFELISTGALVQFASDSNSGSEKVSPAQIPVILVNAASGETYTVDYNVTGGTATGGGTDYTLAAGTLTFDNNSVEEDINIVLINDGDPESNETIVITLSNPNGPSIQLGTPTENTFTIIDGSPLVDFNVAGQSGLETASPVSVIVRLSEAASETITVDYNVTGGTATGGGVDYNMVTSGTLTFSANDVTKIIDINIVSDANSEAPETIIIELSNPNEASLGTNTEYTYWILDDYIDLEVDFALVDCNYNVRTETAKSDWFIWAANRWYDMYSHDGVWEDGNNSKPTNSGIEGTGIHTVITLNREGDMGLKAYDLSGPLGGSACPCGSVGFPAQPITNTWIQAIDWAEIEWGSIQLGFHDLPAGVYELYSYHNNFDCDRTGSNCGGGWTPVTCDCACGDTPNMPEIRAMSCKEARELDYALQSSWQKVFPGISWNDGPYPEGVDSIVEEENFYPQQVSDDANLVPSLIKFRTDGSPVMVLYKAGCCISDAVRPERIGGRGILNAFELVQVADVPDTNAPIPNPATFASAPNAISSTEITMTATTGTDDTGPVQYYFNETTDNNGATDSGWVTNPVYTDDGLDPNTQYTYTVQMRDSVSPTPNTGTVSSSASATTDPEPNSTVDDFNATEDAYVKQAKSTTNYGTSNDLRVRGDTSTKNIHSYVKFVVTGVGTVTDATLTIYSYDVNMDVDVYQSANTTWSEGTIDWSSAPGSTGSVLDTQSAGSSEWVDFDVSTLVTGNGTYAFVLKGDTDASGRDFRSSESAYMPVLSVTHE
ncbi:MAG: Calx-beta domain-containing protein, partial [Planctomycetota bacterium]